MVRVINLQDRLIPIGIECIVCQLREIWLCIWDRLFLYLSLLLHNIMQTQLSYAKMCCELTKTVEVMRRSQESVVVVLFIMLVSSMVETMFAVGDRRNGNEQVRRTLSLITSQSDE